jgi:hypothetical protein
MVRVVARIFGGLGNQLFAYAAARRLTLVNNAELAIDHVSGFRYDIKYRRHYQLDHFAIPCRKASAAERLEPFSRIRRNILRRWNMPRPFHQRSYLQQEGMDFESRLLSFRPTGRLYLEGYWQSEDYFKDVELQIREDLRITPPTDDDNQNMAQQIQIENAVAVHVRFFDEPKCVAASHAVENNLRGDYYERAIAEMERRVPGAHYFLFSDRPEVARKKIPLLDQRITVVDLNKGDSMAHADLWLMTQCQYFIIANSTFSWWAAWLSQRPQKVVIAPGFEMRHGSSFWGFEGLIPNEWIKL